MGIKLDAFEWADFITTGEKVDYSHLYDINILIDWLQKKKIINLTPHDATIVSETGNTVFAKSGTIIKKEVN